MNVTNYPYGRSKKLSIQDANADGLLNQWKPLFFSLPNPHRSNLTKELGVAITLYGKGNTQIAVDDLVVSNDMCETLGECDFESGTLFAIFCLYQAYCVNQLNSFL